MENSNGNGFEHSLVNSWKYWFSKLELNKVHFFVKEIYVNPSLHTLLE